MTAGRLDPTTLLTHLGRDPNRHGGTVNHPIHRASTIVFESVAELNLAKKNRYKQGQVYYGRFGTPDIFAFEAAISQLEEGFGTIATPSGLAACILPLVAFLQPGDHVLVTDGVYEPVRTSLSAFIARNGVEVTFYDPRLGSRIEALIQPNTKMVYLETPSSQTFELQDIPAICAVAKSRNILTVCDNTWATALFHRPLARGVDIVVQAATKYILGHSDAMLGLVTCGEAHYRPMREAANWLGHRVSPDDVFLASRGLRTLAVRLHQHFETGLALATWLEAQPQIRRVIHPALASHPDHAIWRRDFQGASGLFAAILDTTSYEKAAAFVDDLELFGLGVSWGGFESLALPCAPAQARTATTWTEEGVLVRFHAGLENVADLKADLARALLKLGSGN